MSEAPGVDANGYLRTVASTIVQAPFRAVVDDLCHALRTELGTLVDSAYLYGSIARGDAVVGRSDLDAVVVLRRQPTQQEALAVESVRRALESRHAAVSKVDFDVGCRDEVMALEQRNRWGFWLKHHCRCIYGHDLAKGLPLFRPSRAIARAVNGDFAEVLECYAVQIEQAHTATDSAQLHRLIREASKKLIRATHVLRPVDATTWPHTLEDHVALLLESFPEMQQPITFFMDAQRTPRGGALMFVERLRAFRTWMQQRL